MISDLRHGNVIRPLLPTSFRGATDHLLDSNVRFRFLDTKLGQYAYLFIFFFGGGARGGRETGTCVISKTGLGLAENLPGGGDEAVRSWSGGRAVNVGVDFLGELDVSVGDHLVRSPESLLDVQDGIPINLSGGCLPLGGGPMNPVRFQVPFERRVKRVDDLGRDCPLVGRCITAICKLFFRSLDHYFSHGEREARKILLSN